MRAIERKIEEAIFLHCLQELLSDRYITLSLNDGEEEVVSKSRDIAKLVEASSSTDEDFLKVYLSPGPMGIGYVRFTWGNGSCVLSDYATKLELRIKRTLALYNKLERGEFDIVFT